MMSATHRRLLATVTAGIALLLLGAAGAWACTAAAAISLNATGGQPGSTVAVTGDEFVHDGTVEVYWEPNDGERQLLFETTGPGFAQNVTIPEDASAGTHYVKGYGHEEDGEIRGAGAAAFTVPHGAVDGQVVEDGDGPVHAAEVTVRRDGTVVGSDTTNIEGHFRIEGLERGEHEVIVDRTNYERSTTNTDVALGETSQLSFALEREPAEQGEPEPDGSGGPDDSSEDDTAPEGSGPEGSAGVEPQSPPDVEPEGSQGAEPEEPQGSEPADTGSGDQNESPAAEPDPAGEANDRADQPETGEPASSDEPARTDQQPAQGDQASQPTEAATSDQPTDAADAQDEPAEPVAGNAPEPDGDGDSGADEDAADDAAPSRASRDEVLARMPTSDAGTEAAASTPSTDTGTADLWSGLEVGEHQAAMTEAQSGNDRVGIGQQLAVAIGVLGTGLVLLAGGGLAAVRGQRVPALANRRR